jgi:capsular exopolysaccharide synthesis family protein
MPPSNRPRRQSNDLEDFEEDDFPDRQAPRKPGEDKTKQFILKLVGRWHWIVLGLILGYLGASYYLSKLPKEYSSTATLMIKQNTASVLGRAQVDEIDMATAEGMNTLAERIRRPDFLERVATRQNVRELEGLVPVAVDWRPEWLAKKLGSAPVADAPTARAVPSQAVLGGMISNWLTISIRRGTRLLDITITHRVPEVSKALADSIAREYLAEITNDRSEERTNSNELLNKEADETKKSLQLARSAISNYARALESHRKLENVEDKVKEHAHIYLAAHPTMTIALANLKHAQEQFVLEFGIARSAQIDKEYWDQTGKELPDPVTEPEQFVRIARQQLLARTGILENEIETSTKLLNSILERLGVAGVDKGDVAISASVSSFAQVPGWPSSPKPSKILGSGAMSGLAGGVLFALLLIRLDNKFHTVAQIAAETGETVLAAVSDIKTTHLSIAEKNYWKKSSGGKPKAAYNGWDQRLVFRPGTSATNYAEMYRILRASVSLLGDETRRKITLFSSALPGEGKTSTSANFALAAAAQGRKTLLIDLDLRKPSIHKIFGLTRVQEKGGITECLANQAAFEDIIIREPSQENLHIIVSGARAPNPGELLDTGRLKLILAQACRDYDVVVLDTAPLLAVPDTRIVAPLADNVCLVVRAEYTPKGAVHRVLKVLEEDNSSISGIIFNGFKEKRRLIGENYSYGYYKTSRYGRAYRYGYGAYGAYGSDDDD